MKQTLLAMIIFSLMFSIVGCTNALYIYQTERISLTLEGRPDSTQPIQGNLGLKQRIAVITPGMEPDSKTKGKQKSSEQNPSTGGNASTPQQSGGQEETVKGEALSLISSFRFKKEKGGLFDVGLVTIRAALVTGDAAAQLKKEEVKNVAEALSSRATPIYETLAMESIERAKCAGKMMDLVRLTEKKWKDLTDDEKKELGQLTGCSTYNEKLHEAIQKHMER